MGMQLTGIVPRCSIQLMFSYPTTYGEFVKWFQDDVSCYAYLFKIRWPNGFRCMRCGEDKYWFDKLGLYRCQQCLFKSSITAGTIFQDRKKPLLQWFHAAWHITENKHGTSACSLQKALGFGSYHTAWTWLHNFVLQWFVLKEINYAEK